MIFSKVGIEGAFVIELKELTDSRGFFARAFCKNEFIEQGLESEFVQCNLAKTERKGTVRGMHYQNSPYEEAKLVRSIKGAVFDVVVDFRKDSPTYLKWFGVELSDENRKMLYVPKGCAHGYQTLSDNAEVFYQVSEFYAPGAESGFLWNDPAVGITWPITDNTTISDKDLDWKRLLTDK